MSKQEAVTVSVLADSYLASLFEPDHEGYLSIKEIPQIKSYLQTLKKLKKQKTSAC